MHYLLCSKLRDFNNVIATWGRKAQDQRGEICRYPYPNLYRDWLQFPATSTNAQHRHAKSRGAFEFEVPEILQIENS